MTARAGSIAEAARRLLKHEGVRLVVPIEIIAGAERLALRVSDELPSMLRQPVVELGAEENTIRLWSPDGRLASLGGSEENLTIVWVPIERGELEIIWGDFQKIVCDLLAAGYPGCIDCAGPAATEPWDEAASRAGF